MKILKMKNDYNGYNIRLISDGKILDICQTGSDVEMLCRYENFDIISNISFDICSKNEELYKIFNKLYENIITGNVYGQRQEDSEALERNEYYKLSSWYQNNVKDGIITVYSDVYPINCPNIVRLKKYEKKIELDFEQVDGRDYGQVKVPYVITIDIRQSGSRLYEFAYPCRILLSDLQAIDEFGKVKILK